MASGGYRRHYYIANGGSSTVINAGTATALTPIPMDDWLPPRFGSSESIMAAILTVSVTGNVAGDCAILRPDGFNISSTPAARVYSDDSATGSVESSSLMIVPMNTANTLSYSVSTGVAVTIFAIGYEYSIY